jgi:hypothetical protein
MKYILHNVFAYELQRGSTLLSSAPRYPKNVRRLKVTRLRPLVLLIGPWNRKVKVRNKRIVCETLVLGGVGDRLLC